MRNNILTIVSVFIFGAIAGASFALLNAPQSGKRTRAQIRNEISDARYRTRKAMNEAQASAIDKLDEIQDRVKEISDEAMHQTESLKMAFQQAMEKPKAILGKDK